VIALVQLHFAGALVAAALTDHGRWHSRDRALEHALNALCDPREQTGPEHGTFGVRQVEEAVERWQGRIVWRKPQVVRRGRVY
jgi:hypothetical protein